MYSADQVHYKRAIANMHLDQYQVPAYSDLSQKESLAQPKPDIIRSVFGECKVRYRWIRFGNQIELISLTEKDILYKYGSIDPAKPKSDIVDVDDLDDTDPSHVSPSFYIDPQNNTCDVNNEALRAQALGKSLEAPAEEVKEPVEDTRGLLSGSLLKPDVSTSTSYSSSTAHLRSFTSQAKTYGASSPNSPNTSSSSAYTTTRISASKTPSVTRVTSPIESTSSFKATSTSQPPYNASTSSTERTVNPASSTITSTAIPYSQYRASISRLCKPTAATAANQKPTIPYAPSSNRQSNSSLRTSIASEHAYPSTAGTTGKSYGSAVSTTTNTGVRTAVTSSSSSSSNLPATTTTSKYSTSTSTSAVSTTSRSPYLYSSGSSRQPAATTRLASHPHLQFQGSGIPSSSTTTSTIASTPTASAASTASTSSHLYGSMGSGRVNGVKESSSDMTKVQYSHSNLPNMISSSSSSTVSPATATATATASTSTSSCMPSNSRNNLTRSTPALSTASTTSSASTSRPVFSRSVSIPSGVPSSSSSSSHHPSSTTHTDYHTSSTSSISSATPSATPQYGFMRDTAASRANRTSISSQPVSTSSSRYSTTMTNTGVPSTTATTRMAGAYSTSTTTGLRPGLYSSGSRQMGRRMDEQTVRAVATSGENPSISPYSSTERTSVATLSGSRYRH